MRFAVSFAGLSLFSLCTVTDLVQGQSVTASDLASTPFATLSESFDRHVPPTIAFVGLSPSAGADVSKSGPHLPSDSSSPVPELAVPYPTLLPENDISNARNDPFAFDGNSATPFYFWVRHIDGLGIGEVAPYTALGGARVLSMDFGVLMVEAQGGVTNNGAAIGNIGLNRRALVGDTIVGAGLWYDINESRHGNTYQQGAITIEMLQDDWSLRTSVWQPLGPRVRQLRNVTAVDSGGISFDGNNILADIVQTQFDETAMKGIDVEIARSIGTWSGEAFLGYYNLQGRIAGQTNGIRGGLRGYVTPRVAANVSVSNDPIFGTNVYGGFTWFFGGTTGNAPRAIEDKLTIPVERNQQVVVNRVQTTSTMPDVVLTQNGVPITVTHVQAGHLGANLGTFENPFTALPATQPSDVVNVHADTTYAGQQYVVGPSQRFLGEADGLDHMLQTDQLGQITLPRATGGINRPIIQAPNNASAIIVSNNSEVSGFHIDNSLAANAVGISGDAGVNDPFTPVDVNRTVISGGVRGVDIQNSGGAYALTFVDIHDSTGDAIQVSQSGVFSFSGGSVNNPGGNGIAIINTSDITIDGAALNGVLGNGVFATATAGSSSVRLFNNDIASNGNFMDVSTSGTGTLMMHAVNNNPTGANNTISLDRMSAGSELQVVQPDQAVLSADNGGAAVSIPSLPPMFGIPSF